MHEPEQRHRRSSRPRGRRAPPPAARAAPPASSRPFPQPDPSPRSPSSSASLCCDSSLLTYLFPLFVPLSFLCLEIGCEFFCIHDETTHPHELSLLSDTHHPCVAAVWEAIAPLQ